MAEALIQVGVRCFVFECPLGTEYLSMSEDISVDKTDKVMVFLAALEILLSTPEPKWFCKI